MHFIYVFYVYISLSRCAKSTWNINSSLIQQQSLAHKLLGIGIGISIGIGIGIVAKIRRH